MSDGSAVSRRRVLGGVASCAACGVAAPAIAMPRLVRRALALHQLHTGERIDITYWENGRYEPGALQRLEWLMRDFRTGDVHPIDPRLLDLLVRLRQRLGIEGAFEVLSAYRSPATNAMLASLTEGVSPNSLHMAGKAIDIRVPGRSLGVVRRAALELAAGGVGYYPRSQFVHIDVGRPRAW